MVKRPLGKAKKNVDVHEKGCLNISNFKCRENEGKISYPTPYILIRYTILTSH